MVLYLKNAKTFMVFKSGATEKHIMSGKWDKSEVSYGVSGSCQW